MTPYLPALDCPAAPIAPAKKVLRLTKELGAGLGLIILINILVLGAVEILKANGVPKSLANPLQLAYLPLVWGGLRWLKRKYQLISGLAAARPATAAGRLLLALLLVAAMATAVIALLRAHYGLNFSYELRTTGAYPWAFMALMLGEAAAAEELLFRDYLLSATRKATSSFFVLTGLNASFFLLMHVQGFLLGDYILWWGAGIFSIGLFLAAYVLVFQDVVFPICFHALWNISSTLYVENDKTFNLVKFDHYQAHELLISNVTAAVCIGVTLSLFARLAYVYHHQARGKRG